MPGIMTQPYDLEFLFTPGRVTIIQEAYMQVRRVFTDGRPLPDDPDPTYNGSSIGHWEGDTLVVTTIGLREGGTMGRWGITYSDKVKLTERIHLDPCRQGHADRRERASRIPRRSRRPGTRSIASSASAASTRSNSSAHRMIATRSTRKARWSFWGRRSELAGPFTLKSQNAIDKQRVEAR
jgi:hypothetical protein